MESSPRTCLLEIQQLAVQALVALPCMLSDNVPVATPVAQGVALASMDLRESYPCCPSLSLHR